MKALKIAPQVALRPERLNSAGYCIYCGDRWCESARCVSAFARSRWTECDECHGTQRIEDQVALCGWCIGGLTEVEPAAAVVPLAVVPGVAALSAREVSEQEAARLARLLGPEASAELREAAGLVACPPSDGAGRVTVSDPDYRPAAGLAHVPGWGL
ncbi:hypothetical protein ACFYTQ_30830 [Nocardia sp. NPDC004068]|uniref:hypothetical protein n=1 Tax=Nocardia sp. NPDC004068 TaxID=3364303 RepID=UPI0036866851